MRAVIQRVQRASVSVGGQIVGSIGAEAPGLIIFLGVSADDTAADAEWLAGRLIKLRVFDDGEGRMNRSVTDVNGEVLVISQFTLFGSLKKGNRPSFNRSAPPELAESLYEGFVQTLSAMLNKPVPTGRFGEHMLIDVVNDGPVTLIVDTRERDF